MKATAQVHPEEAREMIGTRSVRIAGNDPFAVYQSFVAITYITRVSEGR